MSRRPFASMALALLAGCGAASIDPKDSVALGAAFVKQRGCARCHGADDGTLSGQVTAQPGTSAYGANLTPDRTTGIGGWADIQIVRAMRFGVDDEEQPLCPPMPHLDDLTDLEAGAIVAYLRSLAPVERRVPDSTCPPLKPPPPLDLAMPPPPPDDLGAPGD